MTEHLKSFLKELKTYGQKNNIPNISIQTGELLHMLIMIHKSKKILEIGSANGFSTIFLAHAAKQTKGKVTSIDFSKPNCEMVAKNLKKTRLSAKVEHHFGNALEIIPKLKQKWDFIFIDGEKASYYDFLKCVESKLTKEAILCVDNVKKFPKKTKKFTDYIHKQTKYDCCFVTVSEEDELLIMRQK